MIRVGRREYHKGGYTDPSFIGFIPIIVMTPCTKYGSLGPYSLRNEKGQNMENIWQFSKVYNNVPKSVQKYSRYDSTIIWDWPTETHVDEKGENGYLNSNYLKWRTQGMNAKYPIRYPVGRVHRSKCLFALKEVNEDDCKTPICDLPKLDYVQARKEIYFPTYAKLVKKQSQFHKLKKMLSEGKNLLIIEVDAPHGESLDYYMRTYGVDSNFIINNTMLATLDNLKIMLNDTRHAFGHGYCLAAALQDLDLSI